MNKKILFYLFSFSVLIIYIIFQVTVKPNKDFDIFIEASKNIFHSKSCYDVWLPSGKFELKYYYSPLFGILIYPLACLPQYLYNTIWCALNLFILIRLFNLCNQFIIGKKMPTVKINLFYFLLFLSMARAINDNFDLGQMTFIMVWASIEGLRLIYNKQIILGSAIIALIINIKILPIVVLCYIIYKREFKASSFIILFFCFYLFLPALFIGFKFNNQLLNDWYITLSDSNHNSIFEDLNRQSLSSLIPSLFMNTNSVITLNRHILNLDENSVKIILTSVRILFLISLIPYLGKPFQNIRNKKIIFYQIALIFIIVPIFFPHQGKYSLLFLMPAYAYCLFNLLRLKNISKNNLNYAKKYKTSLIFILVSFSLITLTTDGLIGRHLSDIAEHFHLLVFGTISLLIGTMYLKPKF